MRDSYRLPEQPEVYVISNIVENGKPLGNPNDGFSGTRMPASAKGNPTAYTFLYCLETPPEGGETQFASTFQT